MLSDGTAVFRSLSPPLAELACSGSPVLVVGRVSAVPSTPGPEYEIPRATVIATVPVPAAVPPHAPFATTRAALRSAKGAWVSIVGVVWLLGDDSRVAGPPKVTLADGAVVQVNTADYPRWLRLAGRTVTVVGRPRIADEEHWSLHARGLAAEFVVFDSAMCEGVVERCEG